jgi:hypothetical protein
MASSARSNAQRAISRYAPSSGPSKARRLSTAIRPVARSRCTAGYKSAGVGLLLLLLLLPPPERGEEVVAAAAAAAVRRRGESSASRHFSTIWCVVCG